jgi:hypothetical protein
LYRIPSVWHFRRQSNRTGLPTVDPTGQYGENANTVPLPRLDTCLHPMTSHAQSPFEFPRVAQCLTHQRPEDQMTPLGLVCPDCKQRLYLAPPTGRCQSFWESQPGANALRGEPCWVYTLVWDDFRIRSLHPAHVENDIRGSLATLLTVG